MKKIKYLGLMLLCTVMSLSFTACSDDDDDYTKKLSQNELSLIAGQSVKLMYNGDCAWKSDEPLIAEVDNGGNVTANRVGETTIWANNESCKVKVTPKYDTYIEPLVDWGASENEVTSFMAGFDYLGKEDNMIGFYDDMRGIGYLYMFTNNSLTASAITANVISKGDEVVDFLLERYVTVNVDENSNTVVMASIDGKMGVGVKLNAGNGLMMVIYAPFNANSVNTKTIISRLNKQMAQNSVNEETLIDVDILNSLLRKFNE